MTHKKQTCLKPVYTIGEDGKKTRSHYEIKLPKIITEDLGFEMQFGWPSPKGNPKQTGSGIKVHTLDQNQ